MKILLAHVVHSPGIDRWYADVAAAAPQGIHVTPFCITLNPPGPRLSAWELDRAWQRRDPALFATYRRLIEAAQGHDALLLYNGANLHPEALPCLPTFNAFACFDDPESSPGLSRPVAPAFDAAFHGNVASRFQYESWGCRKLAWLPVFTAPSDVPSHAERDALLAAPRTIDAALVCERNDARRARLDALADAFPAAVCRGRGWPAGPIDDRALRDLYRAAKVGWNVHNTTGPINRRLFALAAFGVAPLCDNKTGLGHAFTLGQEALGFDTIPEAIELTRHLLQHDDERRRIAAAAFDRFWRDYHAAALWRRIADQLAAWGAGQTRRNPSPLPSRDPAFLARRALRPARRAASLARRAARRLHAAARPQPAPAPRPIDDRAYLGVPVPAYTENPERAHENRARQRLENGDPLDWPNILALNWAVTTRIGNARRIVEIGSGTGPFAEFASVDPGRSLECFEGDDFALQQARARCRRPNVRFLRHPDHAPSGAYDLLVSVEVIEHVDDLDAFLRLCRGLAPRAIFTTPNRAAVRGADDAGPPAYAPHVREFTPGELYWLLRQHYRDVQLFHMPDVFVPWLEPMTVASKGTPIIAECAQPVAAAPAAPHLADDHADRTPPTRAAA